MFVWMYFLPCTFIVKKEKFLNELALLTFAISFAMQNDFDHVQSSPSKAFDFTQQGWFWDRQI